MLELTLGFRAGTFEVFIRTFDACTATSHTHACIVGPISRPDPGHRIPHPIPAHQNYAPQNNINIATYDQGIINHQDQDFTRLGSTLIKVTVLEQSLATYPDIQNAQFLLNGFKYGFYLNYIDPRVYLQSKYMKSASEQADQLLAMVLK